MGCPLKKCNLIIDMIDDLLRDNNVKVLRGKEHFIQIPNYEGDMWESRFGHADSFFREINTGGLTKIGKPFRIPSWATTYIKNPWMIKSKRTEKA